MNARTLISVASVAVIIALLVGACGGAAAPAPPRPSAVAPAAAPTSAPARAPQPTQAPPPTVAVLSKPGALSQSGVSDIKMAPPRVNQMIIKNGEMNLLVADVDVALDRATGIAVDLGGYLLSGKSWMQDGFKYASLTVGVPVDQFETAQRRMRALAVQVLNDTASGQDVSTEYVDTQSRVTNLEATAARIREFLKQAKDVDEALAVNAKLAEVEDEIEKAKGRMQYLRDRAAYSTLTVSFEPQRPTPTATPEPTPTLEPTPAMWRPDKTLTAATGTLAGLLQVMVDALIWLTVVVGPFALPVVGIVLLWRYVRRNQAKRRAVTVQQPAPTDPAIGDSHSSGQPVAVTDPLTRSI